MDSEKCYKCGKKIDLVESYYNDNMCKECWYDEEYGEIEN